jgi:hypothetical protein
MELSVFNDDTGVYEVVTSSGSVLILDMDKKAAIRSAGLLPGTPGYRVNLEGFVDGWWTGVVLDSPVEVGERIFIFCDPPMNWYISTPVVSITKVDSPFYENTVVY